MRFAEDVNGGGSDVQDIASFWHEAKAVDEASRRNSANTDSTVTFEVIESEATGVYPADENPPWASDPERLARRGYETAE
jgi:hypothetical protein